MQTKEFRNFVEKKNESNKTAMTIPPQLFQIKMPKKLLCIAAASLALAISATSQEIDFKNESNDTTRITNMLIEECSHRDAGNVARIAEKFIGTPYCGGTLDRNDKEKLTINLDEMDCTTFVETVLAMAYTASENRQSWHDFAYNLQRIRYRNGEINGYPSRLHYISDWILDNVSRGNFKEITADMHDARYNIKSLDYMSSNKDKYAALADSANLAGIKNIEAGFSNHRFPYLKGSSLKDKKLASELYDGDIICFTTSTKGLDITHMAIVRIIEGSARMIHASSKEGKVILDPLNITEYARHHRSHGIRIIRLVTY